MNNPFGKKPLDEHLLYLDPEKPGLRDALRGDAPQAERIIAWVGTLVLTFLFVLSILTVLAG